MTAPLLFTSAPVRYETVLHSCERTLVGARALTCDSVHSWWLYSATSLEHQATGTMTCDPTLSQYPATEPTSPVLPYPNNAKRQTNINFKVIGLTRPVFETTSSICEPETFRFPDLPEWEVDALLIQLYSFRLVKLAWWWCLCIVRSISCEPICTQRLGGAVYTPCVDGYRLVVHTHTWWVYYTRLQICLFIKNSRPCTLVGNPDERFTLIVQTVLIKPKAVNAKRKFVCFVGFFI